MAPLGRALARRVRPFSPLLPLLLLLLLGGAPAARAQLFMRSDANRPSAHLGLTTGLAATWVVDHRLLEDPNYLDVQTYRRAPIGFTFGYHFNDRNGVQLEMNRTRQGADLQIIGSDDDKTRLGTKNINLDYWSMPVLFKYTSGAARRTRFEFHLGPQVNFLNSAEEVNRYDRAGKLRVLSGKTDLTPENTPGGLVKANTRRVMATTTNYRPITLSGVFGLGVEVKVAGPIYCSALLRGTFTVDEVRSTVGQEQARKIGYYARRQNAVVGLQVGLHWQFITPAEGHPKDRPY